MGTIYREIKQARPFEKPEDELVVTLLRTADVVRHALETALRASNVSLEQYNVLRILKGAPTGLPTLELASRMISRCTNISRILPKLTQKGLVQRRKPGQDRRVAVNEISPKGLETLRRATVAVERTNSKASSIQKSRMASLIEGLDILRAGMAVDTARHWGRGE